MSILQFPELNDTMFRKYLSISQCTFVNTIRNSFKFGLRLYTCYLRNNKPKKQVNDLLMVFSVCTVKSLYKIVFLCL